jgi:hypothetical protein
MGGMLFVREEREENRLIRRIMISILFLALIAALAVGAVIHFRTVRAEQTLTDFSQAMADGRYADVVALYRQTRDRALADSPLDRNTAFYQEALTVMEAETSISLDLIESKLTGGLPLSEQEIAMAEGLAEMSAARLITCLRNLSKDYLFGRKERAVVDLAFEQTSTLGNISQGVVGIAAEFDRMDEIRAEAADSVKDLDEGRYWAAWDGCQALLALGDLGAFTREQILLLAERCKEEMYEPLLNSALTLMSGGRYLSAQKALRALEAVFPDQAAVSRAIADCAPFIPAQLIAYQGPIEFITIKPLINNPARAFDGDAYSAAAFDSMLTVTEFSSMIRELHENDFILVDGDALYNDSRQLQTLFLPPGKKPLVLVIEGLNYYATRRETGNAWNLVIDEGGEVAAEVPDAKGNLIIDRYGEAVGILDLFVAEHPDFSLDGAKGTISLTGYECVFGYVTDKDQLDDRNNAFLDNGMAAISLSDREIEANRAAATQVIERLKETGWRFASSTYGFINARDHDLDRIRTDTQKWFDQVGSLTGPVSMLHYPNGAFITGSDERAEYLKDQGFVLFGGIGASAYLFIGNRYIYVDKVPVNGYTLRNSRQYGLERFFDVERVYDRAARNP